MFYKERDFPWAAPFYEMVPLQIYSRDGAIPIDDRVNIPSMTLYNLLDRMAARLGSGGEALIVNHGADLGLAMHLDSGTSTSCNVDAVNLLNADRPPQDVAGPLGLVETQVQRLRDAAGRVRALGLRRVEVRACNLGRSGEWMRAFKRLLGPRVLGAPRALNAYGRLEPGRYNNDSAYWGRWREAHPDARVYELAPGQLVAMEPLTHELSRGAVPMLATNEAAVIAWARRHLTHGERLTPRSSWRQVPYHAMFLRSEPFPMVWHGEDAYVDQIAHV